MQEKMNLKGSVKWFSSEKGFGFITSEEIENDIYIHFSDIQMKGFKSLDQDDKVIFDYDAEKKKAVNVRKITDEESNVENDSDSE